MNTRLRKLRHRWTKSEAPVAPPLAVQTTFRHLESSPAISARVEAEARKLQRYFEGITHCHVVILAPHRHHRRGRHYAIQLEVGVPGERLVINHEPRIHPRLETEGPSKRTELQVSHKDIYTVLRAAFDTARRRLEDYARRRRGDVKRHSAPPPA